MMAAVLNISISVLSELPTAQRNGTVAQTTASLEVGIQNNLAAAANGHHGFESVIVSDLEFLRLRKHENYTHHAHEKPAVDVESEAVPTEVSGVLTLQNHPRSFVISETQNQETQGTFSKLHRRSIRF
jgi:hypothetical protein